MQMQSQQPPRYVPPPPLPRNRNAKVLIPLAALFGLLVVGCTAALVATNGTHGKAASSGSPTPDPAALAIRRCRAAVLKQLKAPATARWPGDEKATPDGSGGYEVTGHVDAENSFGALLRNLYICNTNPSKGTNAVVY